MFNFSNGSDGSGGGGTSNGAHANNLQPNMAEVSGPTAGGYRGWGPSSPSTGNAYNSRIPLAAAAAVPIGIAHSSTPESSPQPQQNAQAPPPPSSLPPVVPLRTRGSHSAMNSDASQMTSSTAPITGDEEMPPPIPPISSRRPLSRSFAPETVIPGHARSSSFPILQKTTTGVSAASFGSEYENAPSSPTPVIRNVPERRTNRPIEGEGHSTQNSASAISANF